MCYYISGQSNLIIITIIHAEYLKVVVQSSIAHSD